MLESVNSAVLPSVDATGLGIEYRRYRKRDMSLKDAVLGLFRGTDFEQFWALRGLDLRLYPGDRLGVVGPNGAGKSTLLRAIAGILRPSEGSLTVRGSLVPLLELGGGFNLELTGRENIYLNGAILGLVRSDIAVRVQRIASFAGVGDFLDSPLRTYSTGMRSRLGFSIAVDVDPDILLLDEVFSVGDQEFRQKATEKMSEFFSGKKTIVFVSHNLKTVADLCNRAVFIQRGDIVASGTPEEVIERYQETCSGSKPRTAQGGAAVG